jgi:hypothetical protein
MDDINIELIIHRLDEIAKKQDEVNQKVEELSIQLAKVKTIENTVDNIKEWKERQQEVISTSEIKEMKEWKGRMDELMSPKQLEQYIKEHDNFKTFKTQAMMIWVVVQALMTVALFWDKIFG